MISMNKYNRLMEHVNPSPDMEQRLHAALDQSPVRKPNPWRCSIPFAAAGCLLAIIFSIATIKPVYAQTAPDHTKPPVTATAPQDYDTTDALAAALSFPLALPQTLPDGYAFDSASDQFGMEWLEQISGDYGGQCMKDYLSAIDDISKEPYVDTNRLGCVGASFGGFSVYWLATP